MKSQNKKDENDPLYRAWASMRRRCGNSVEKRSAYKDRGIYVDDVWKYDFDYFKKWALNNGWKEGLTLDRIDNNGPYSPDNCRWADAYTQMNNTRSNHHVIYNGESHTIAEWSRIKNISVGVLRQRIRHNWPVDRLFTPVRQYIKVMRK